MWFSLSMVLILIGFLAPSKSYSVTNQCSDYYFFDSKERTFKKQHANSTKEEMVFLRNGLERHLNLKEISIGKTRQAFSNFLKIIDPHNIFISHEDLTNVGADHPDFYKSLHNQLFSPEESPVHKQLSWIAVTRLNRMVQRFLRQSSFRQEVIDRAKRFDAEEKSPFTSKVEKKSDLENRVLDFLAWQLSFQAKYFKDDNGSSINHLQKLMVSLEQEIIEYRTNITNETLPRIIAKSYFQTFDRYSDILLPTELVDFQKNALNGKKIGIGIVFQHSLHGYKITSVLENTSAQKNGLEVGDEIIAINPNLSFANVEKMMGRPEVVPTNWKLARTLTMKQISKLISGNENSHLMLRVNRNGKEMVVILERREFASAQSTISPLKIEQTPNGAVGVLKFESFSKGLAETLNSQVESAVKTENLKGLVLDLRGNYGGIAEEMAGLVDMFVPSAKSVILTEKFQSYPTPSSRGKAKYHWDGPLVVLINEKSASAAEALAAALKDYRRAIIVGTPESYGKGSAHSTDSNGVRVTEELFYSPFGHSIQWTGVPSDIILMQTHKTAKREKDYENSLVPKNKMIRDQKIDWAWEDLRDSLKQNSNERLSRIERPDNDAAIEQINLEEAIRILTDMIASP